MDQTLVNRDIVRLLHIRDAIARIESYARVGDERFCDESMTRDATIRQLEIICEATRNVSAELREQHPELASSRLGELQQEFEHHYLDLDLQLAWDVTRTTLPELKETVAAILDDKQRDRTG